MCFVPSNGPTSHCEMRLAPNSPRFYSGKYHACALLAYYLRFLGVIGNLSTPNKEKDDHEARLKMYSLRLLADFLKRYVQHSCVGLNLIFQAPYILSEILCFTSSFFTLILFVGVIKLNTL